MNIYNCSIVIEEVALIIIQLCGSKCFTINYTVNFCRDLFLNMEWCVRACENGCRVVGIVALSIVKCLMSSFVKNKCATGFLHM
ncbi:hypothetical protein T06_1141 [Trichinella sp. T6]|nr:hypothetical protein T06_1141 [Trichinella sp. T6]